MTRQEVRNYIFNFPTKYEQGFTNSEIYTVIEDFPPITHNEFFRVLGVNTVMVIGGETVTYACDIEKTLMACLEGRELNWWEVD
jgi:hypothetical protein